jgi:hypothetical protein
MEESLRKKERGQINYYVGKLQLMYIKMTRFDGQAIVGWGSRNRFRVMIKVSLFRSLPMFLRR